MSKLKDTWKSIKPEKISNFRVIILCILAATTFKFFNSLNGNYSTTLNYPLEFIYDEKEYIAVETLPSYVQLNVNGLGWNLFRNSLGIKVSPIKIPLDKPSELKRIPGAAIPSFISDQLSEFELNYVLTDTLLVDLDYRDSKVFQVKVDSSDISLEGNYRIVSSVTCYPDTVRLDGPKSLLAQLPDTIMVNLPESNIEEDYDDDVVINIPNSQLIKRNPPTVNVKFDTKEFTTVTREIPMDTIGFPNSSRLSLDVLSANIEYEVEAEAQSEVDVSEFIVVLDYAKMNLQDSTILPELITYPKELLNVKMDTLKVRLLPSINE